MVPDSVFPALTPGLRTHPETVGVPPFALTVPIPQGWVRSNPAPGEWRWYPSDKFEFNTYFLRVRLVGNRYQPVPDALAERMNALRDAADVAELNVEETTANSFRATYVADEHRRVTMERFLPGPTGNAFAWIALIGREFDRAGMADLFPTITNGSRRVAQVNPWASMSSRTRLAVAVSSLRTWTHSNRLAATWRTRSTTTPSGQSR